MPSAPTVRWSPSRAVGTVYGFRENARLLYALASKSQVFQQLNAEVTSLTRKHCPEDPNNLTSFGEEEPGDRNGAYISDSKNDSGPSTEPWAIWIVTFLMFGPATPSSMQKFILLLIDLLTSAVGHVCQRLVSQAPADGLPNRMSYSSWGNICLPAGLHTVWESLRLRHHQCFKKSFWTVHSMGCCVSCGHTHSLMTLVGTLRTPVSMLISPWFSNSDR